MGDLDRISGRIRGLQHRTEVSGGHNTGVSSRQVLTFRLDPLDGGAPVAVTMKGAVINGGGILDGEVVDVDGRWRGTNQFKAKRITSRDSGLSVDNKVPAWALAVAGVIGVAVLGFIGVGVVSAVTQDDPLPRPPAVPSPGVGEAGRTGPGRDAGRGPSFPERPSYEQELQQCLADGAPRDFCEQYASTAR